AVEPARERGAPRAAAPARPSARLASHAQERRGGRARGAGARGDREARRAEWRGWADAKAHDERHAGGETVAVDDRAALTRSAGPVTASTKAYVKCACGSDQLPVRHERLVPA